MAKNYRCYKCGKVLDYKPTRMVKQKYGAGYYKQYYQVKTYDLCKNCYSKLDKWLERRRNDV